MPKLDKVKELKGLRAHLDAHLPGWREGMLGERGEAVCFHADFKDGTQLDLVLHMKPEPVTVEFGGTEFGEFEPGGGA